LRCLLGLKRAWGEDKHSVSMRSLFLDRSYARIGSEET
jgi:hypothetical protein